MVFELYCVQMRCVIFLRSGIVFVSKHFPRCYYTMKVPTNALEVLQANEHFLRSRLLQEESRIFAVTRQFSCVFMRGPVYRLSGKRVKYQFPYRVVKPSCRVTCRQSTHLPIYWPCFDSYRSRQALTICIWIIPKQQDYVSKFFKKRSYFKNVILEKSQFAIWKVIVDQYTYMLVICKRKLEIWYECVSFQERNKFPMNFQNFTTTPQYDVSIFINEESLVRHILRELSFKEEILTFTTSSYTDKFQGTSLLL